MAEINFERGWAEYMIVEAAYSPEMDALRQDLLDGIVEDPVDNPEAMGFKKRIAEVGRSYGLSTMTDNMAAYNIAIQTARQGKNG